MKENMHTKKIVYITTLLLLCVGLHTNLFSQAVGDYRSLQTGNWGTTGTWEIYDGTAWVAATAYPRAGNTSGVITIRNGHNVTVNLTGLEVNQVVVENGGTISFASSPSMVTMDVLVSLLNNGTVEVTDTPTSDSRLNISGQMINNNYVEVQVDCHLNVYGYFENNATVITNQDVSWWGKFNVNAGAVLKCSPTSYIGGGGHFVLNDEATIIVGSPDGINALGTNTGNIRTTVVRDFSPNAHYIYDGVANQVTGTALTASVNVTISNTAGVVTFSRAVTMDILKIDLGAKVNLNNFTHTSGILILPIGSYSLDTWGSTASAAVNKNDVYFDVATGGVVQLTNKAVYSFAQTTTFSTCVTDTLHPISVEVWGGGGKGGTRTTNGGGGGGGGGAYSSRTITVIPGNVYTVTVGAGSKTTGAGGDSWFSPTPTSTGALVLAKGGSSVPDDTRTRAAGGNANDGIGTTRRSGGQGATGSSNTGSYGGGGGSSAGRLANGTSPGTGTTGSPPPISLGAIAPAGGGNGGNAKFSNTGPGSNGRSPGGGGGGGFRSSSGTGYGGNGADGRVVISYTPIFPVIYLTDTHIFVCQGVTSDSLYYSSTIGCPTLYMIDFSTAANSAGFQDVAYAALPSGSIPISIPNAAPGGIYQGVLTVKNGAGYPSSRIFTVEVNEIKFTTTGNDVSCYGSNDGNIAIDINSNNNSPYVFSTNNGGNYSASFTGTYPTFTLSNLSPATYQIRIRDKFGCTTTVCP